MLATDVLLSLLLAGGFADSRGDRTSSLTIDPSAPRETLPRTGDVVIEGFALVPRGRFTGDRFTVRAPRGEALPCDVRVTGRHPDGSVRAATIVAAVPRAAAESGARLTFDRGASGSPARLGALAVRETDDSVTVDTGALEIVLARTGSDLVPRLVAGKRDLRAGRGVAELRARAGFGDASSAGEESRSVRVEDLRNLTARVVVRGAIAGPDGEPHASYRLVLAFTRGSPAIAGRVEVTPAFDFGLTDSIELVLPIEAQDVARIRVLAGGPEAEGVRGRRIGAAGLDGQRLEAFVGGDRAPLDPTLRSGVRAAWGGTALGLATSRLRASSPRLVEWTGDGALRLAILGAPDFVEEDSPACADFTLVATALDDRIRVEDVDRRLAMEPRPALAPSEPADAVRAAFPADAALFGKNLTRIEDAVARTLFALDAGLDSIVGARDFGDYPRESGFANLEYDPARAFLLAAIGRGDAGRWLGARDMLLHWTRHDRSDGVDASTGFVPAGFPWQHGREHQSFRHEAGHVWAGGIVTAALVLEDPDLRAAAHELRAALVAASDDVDTWRRERCFAWMLLALDDVLMLEPDPQVLAAIRRLERRLLALQDPAGFFRIDPAAEGSDARWSPATWVTAGITVEALYRVRLHQNDRDLDEALRRAASFLVDLARDADKTYAGHVDFGPALAGGRSFGAPASAVDQLMIAAGLGRLVLLDAHPAAAEAFDDVLVRSTGSIRTARLSPNAAARALVALRSIADTQCRSDARR